jgi:DNA-binding FadR family transcriptional regulator
MRRIFAETTELRCIIEPAAAALAAERATEAQIRTILDAAYAMHPEEGDVQALFDADCQFHVTILDATRNQVMRQLRQIIITMLRVSYDFGVSRPENDPVTRQGHILVAEAIARHDSKAARKNMSKMLEKNRSLARVE